MCVWGKVGSGEHPLAGAVTSAASVSPASLILAQAASQLSKLCFSGQINFSCAQGQFCWCPLLDRIDVSGWAGFEAICPAAATVLCPWAAWTPRQRTSAFTPP